MIYQNAVLLLQVCPQRREAYVSFPPITTSRPVAIAGGGGGLQLAWLQSVGYFKAGCHWPVNDENICVNAEHLGHCSSMSLTKAAWCVPPQVACALNVHVPPFRMNSGLGNDKVLHSAWQLLHCMF